MNNNVLNTLKNNLLKKIKVTTFFKECSLLTKMLIYIITLLIFVLSITIFTKSYVKYQQTYLERLQPVSLQEFIDNDEIITKGGEIKMVFTSLKFNQLLKSGIQNSKISSLKENKILECQYDNDSQLVYLNVKDKNEKVYYFVCKGDIKLEDKQLKLNLYDYRLGNFKSRILGNCYKALLGLPSKLNLGLTNKNNILLIKGINKSSPTEIEVSYEYNYDQLIKRFNEYRKYVDEAKVKLYDKDKKISPEIIDAFTSEKLTKDKVEKCIRVLEKNSSSLEKCALLLSEQGIREICSDLKSIYSKNISVDKLVEKSENELDKSLRKYHYDFSRMLLSYLYVHRDYIINDQSIYVDGTPLTSDKILNENSYSKVYDIEIVSDSKNISAVYKFGNKTVSKAILRKE